MAFVEIPIATNRNELLSNGLSFATGINWSSGEAGTAFRTQKILIGSDSNGSYIAYYRYTDSSIPKVTLRAILLSYTLHRGYITPFSYDRVDSFQIPQGNPGVNEINVYEGVSGIDVYSSDNEAIADFIAIYGSIPIVYHLTNCTASSAPTEAVSGEEVVINITPSQGYILRSSGVSVVDSTGVAVPHIVQGNQIAFTMPYAP